MLQNRCIQRMEFQFRNATSFETTRYFGRFHFQPRIQFYSLDKLYGTLITLITSTDGWGFHLYYIELQWNHPLQKKKTAKEETWRIGPINLPARLRTSFSTKLSQLAATNRARFFASPKKNAAPAEIRAFFYFAPQKQDAFVLCWMLLIGTMIHRLPLIIIASSNLVGHVRKIPVRVDVLAVVEPYGTFILMKLHFVG